MEAYKIGDDRPDIYPSCLLREAICLSVRSGTIGNFTNGTIGSQVYHWQPENPKRFSTANGTIGVNVTIGGKVGTNGTIGSPSGTIGKPNGACVHSSTNGTNGIPMSFKVLPMVPLVKTVGSQYCRQSTVWAKLPTLESHMIPYGVLNFKFINFTNKHCSYRDDISK